MTFLEQQLSFGNRDLYFFLNKDVSTKTNVTDRHTNESECILYHIKIIDRTRLLELITKRLFFLFYT